MKKCLFFIPLLAFAINTNAQTKFGAKAGLNVSNLSGDNQNADAKVGFHVGGYANIKFAEKFAFQPELLYSAQGAKESGQIYVNQEIGNVNADVKYKLDYINDQILSNSKF
ncbi:outer membrane beta-barrel protein [Empedobacter falsenii]